MYNIIYTLLFHFFSCNECSCDARGSSNLTCNSTSGHCVCKEFVEGDQCDRCIAGYSFLEASNPSGCSAGMLYVCSYWIEYTQQSYKVQMSQNVLRYTRTNFHVT